MTTVNVDQSIKLAPEGLPPIMVDDILDLLNVVIAERHGGYTRTLGMTGWVWKGADAEGRDVVYEMKDLPPVAGTGFALMEFLDNYCDVCNLQAPENARLVWAINRKVGGDYVVAIIESWRHKETGEVKNTTRAFSQSDDAGATIAMVLAKMSGMNLEQMHRELFSWRYKSRANG